MARLSEMPNAVRIFDDPSDLMRAAAGEIVSAAQKAVDERGRFTWALAGGSTPRALYRLLASDPYRERMPWNAIHFFWGDERHVPPDHPDSNYGMLHESFASRVPIPAANLHRIAGERAPEAARDAYDAELRAELSVAEGGGPRALFDVMLLGLGEDGHTASLFPGSAVERSAWVATRRHPQTGQWRISLTEPLLNAARLALFIVSGRGKAERLHEILQGPRDPQRLPAQRIAPSGRLRFCVDQAAAQRMLTA